MPPTTCFPIHSSADCMTSGSERPKAISLPLVRGTQDLSPGAEMERTLQAQRSNFEDSSQQLLGTEDY